MSKDVVKLPTVNIKGKDYVMVKDRLSYFREHYPDYTLDTEIIQLDDKAVYLKAFIADKEGRRLASGMAFEEKKGMINSTSYIENCETSAWGRALANFGIGIDDSVGGADEVATAINKQGEKPNNGKQENPFDNAKPKNTLVTSVMIATLLDKIKAYNEACGVSLTAEMLLAKCGLTKIEDMDIKVYKNYMDKFDKAIGKAGETK